MASFSIPLIFTAEPKPDQLFSLDVSQAREHPDLINTFATDTWNSLADSELFPGDSSRNPQRPRFRDKLAQRWSVLRRNQFKPFSLLPIELQEKVWESCLEPVTHTVVFPVEVKPPNRRISNKTWLLESPGNKSDRRILPVPLWQICRQSRAVANRFYRLLQPGVYFSPIIDTLRLSIMSYTKVYRSPLEEPPRATIHCNETLVEFLDKCFVATNDSAEEISFKSVAPHGPTVKNKSDYTYTYRFNGNTSYKTHLHEYSQPYILSLIPRKILQEVQNLEVLFYYDPRKSIAKQDRHGHLYNHFLANSCPILDLTGLQWLVLKVAVVKPPASLTDSLSSTESLSSTNSLAALDSWGKLIHKLVARNRNEEQGRRTRGLPGLQSLEVAKMCALVEKPELYFSTMSRRSATWYHARRRFRRKLSETSWRPSRRDVQKSKPT